VRPRYLPVKSFGLAAAALALIDMTGAHSPAQRRFVLQTDWHPELPIGAERGQSTAACAAQRNAFMLLHAYATGVRRAEAAPTSTDALYHFRIHQAKISIGVNILTRAKSSRLKP
jgi:hypothetical protein